MEESENNTNNGASVVANDETQSAKLQSKLRKMENEYNAQRAKMKEMYMQKETECLKAIDERRQLQQELDDLKSQFLVADLKSENEMQLKELKAQEEISSLQQLVQDTIEESTICKAELERLKEEYARVWQEYKDLREYHQQNYQHPQPQPQHESTSSGGGGGLAPQMLNQVKRTTSTIARKLVGDSMNSMGSFQQDSIDEGTRPKGVGNQYAHEDAEVLRSIVEQLQEEMKALKEKLRETDDKLHAKRIKNKTVATVDSEVNTALPEDAMHKSTSTDLAETTCQACIAAETKYEEFGNANKTLQTQLEVLKKNVEESYENLKKEAALRKDLEDQWQEKREAHKSEVQALRDQAKTNEKRLHDMQQKFLETKEEVMKQLQRVSDDRESVNKQLETLQADNDFLSGRYLKTSEEIDGEKINLPNTVSELQVFMLQLHNELIQARVGSEYEKKKGVTAFSEIELLRDQLESVNNEYEMHKKKVQTETKSLQDRITKYMLTVQDYETSKTQLERKEAELNRQVSDFRVENIELKENNEKLIRASNNDKSKIKQLQDNLTTNEQVQKDFVKLSQTLQISLEKLRHDGTEVRWEDDEDVDNCPTCSTFFTVTVRKIHCRHCGHIYCDKCLTKTVPSGPRKRSARVCDICHTLLMPNTAPYFSHEPIQSN